MKTKTKIILTIIAMLVIVCLFNIGTVNAATNEELQHMLDILPNEISLDIPEVEFEKTNTLIENKIKDIWQQQGIDASNCEITIFGPSLYSIENFHKTYIFINSSNNTAYRDTIKVKYNNTDKFNTTDQQAVKNIRIESPRYYEVPIQNGMDGMTAIEQAKKYYSNLIKDNTISIGVYSGAGGMESLNSWTWESGTCVGLFKNGILYNTIVMGEECAVPVIDVPATVSDSELNNYITTILKRYYTSDFLKEVVSITKGATITDAANHTTNPWTKEVKDGYTVKATFAGLGTEDSYIIVHREQPKIDTVTRTDTNTNVKLESSTDVIPADTQLVVEKLTSGDIYSIVEKSLGTDINKFTLYDITLKQNNVNIQPNGKVKISIPVPEGYDTSKIAVYRVAEDGTKTEYEITIENGYITFETDHFSNYVVAEKNITENEDKNVETSKTEEKDVTPKTGTRDIITYIGIIIFISAVGIVAIKRK